jgi:hypothetical protein
VPMKHISLVTVSQSPPLSLYMQKLIPAQLIFQNSALILVRMPSTANHYPNAIEEHTEHADTVEEEAESVSD